MKKPLVISLATLYFILLIDQSFLWHDGRPSRHFLNCLINRCDQMPYQKDPDLAYRLNPSYIDRLHNDHPPGVEEKNIKYNVDNNGFRLSHEKRKDGQLIINLYGDDLVFGPHIKADRTIDTFLNRMSQKCHFRNFGVPHYNINQMVALSHKKDYVGEADLHVFLLNTDTFYRITKTLSQNPYVPTDNVWDIQNEYLKEDVINFPAIPKFLIWNLSSFKKIYTIFERQFWTKVDTQTLFKEITSRAPQNSHFFHLPTMHDYQKEGKRELFILKALKEISIGDKTLTDPTEVSSYFYPELILLNPIGAQWAAIKIQEQLKEECF